VTVPQMCEAVQRSSRSAAGLAEAGYAAGAEAGAGAVLPSSWGLGRVPDTRTLLPALLAACFFVLAVAPGLLMFCVPFTVGVYGGVLLAARLGASAGGALGGLLRPRAL
jgi:hypothetical protein